MLGKILSRIQLKLSKILIWQSQYVYPLLIYHLLLAQKRESYCSIMRIEDGSQTQILRLGIKNTLLFKQEKLNDWESVFEKVKQKLTLDYKSQNQ